MIERLTRVVSRALRHAPDEYGLVLDTHGWARTDELIEALRTRDDEFSSVTQDDIGRFALDGERFQLQNGMIRARYGHSSVEVDYGPPQIPPAQLFHATSTKAFADIAPRGLTAQGRRHVHLTSSWDYVRKIYEQRKTECRGAVILVIAASDAAARTGAPFFQVSDSIWLTAQVGREFISLAELSRDGGDIRQLRPLWVPGCKGNTKSLAQRLSSLLPED